MCTRIVWFPKPEGPVLAVTAIFQILNVPVSTTGCFGVYWVVLNDYFLGDKYKSFSPPSFRGCWCHP
jgi:hypothetical protein